jgi:hypothetical protein
MTSKTIVNIVKIDNVRARIITDHPFIMKDVYNFFSIYVDQYWFKPKVKAGLWDGKINFVQKNGIFGIGLLKYVYNFIKRDDIIIKIDKELTKKTQVDNFNDITLSWLSDEWVPREHQLRGALKAITQRRGVLEHATSSGKSLTIALIIMYFIISEEVDKCLLLVPTLGLIEQMRSDLISYGVPEEWIGRFNGKIKDTTQPIIISTWQSMAKQKQLTQQFKLLVSDECLHPDTNITMADGSTKKISNIHIGDIVKTVNESTNMIEDKPVKYIHKNISKHNQMYEIELCNGKKIKITGNHKIRLVSGEWKQVDMLDGSEDIDMRYIQ